MKKGLKIALTVICGALILLSLLDIKDLVIVFLIAAAGIYFTWRKPRPKKTKEIVQETKPTHRTLFDFNIVGTHYEQQGELTGQEILAKIPKQIMKENDAPLYDGYTKKEMEEQLVYDVDIYSGYEFDVKVVETTYEGEYAVEVHLIDDDENTYKIGYVKKTDLDLFKDVFHKNTAVWLEIEGGLNKDVNGEIEESEYRPILYVKIA